MLKLVFVDMDDTFVATDKTIPADNLRILDVAHEHGVGFVPCTGRSTAGLPRELVEHPCVRYAVCGGGAIIYDVNEGSIVSERPIDRKAMRALYSQLRPLSTTFDLFTDEGIYTADDRWHVLDEMSINEAFRTMLKGLRTRFHGTTEELLDQVGTVCRINVFFSSEKVRQAVWRAVRSHPEFTCVSSMPWNVELTRAGVDKGFGLRRVCALLGVDVADTVAFGDSGNDVSMLRAAGDGVAMGNASPECRAAADHVTLRCDEAGVARYLEPLLG